MVGQINQLGIADQVFDAFHLNIFQARCQATDVRFSLIGKNQKNLLFQKDVPFNRNGALSISESKNHVLNLPITKF